MENSENFLLRRKCMMGFCFSLLSQRNVQLQKDADFVFGSVYIYVLFYNL